MFGIKKLKVFIIVQSVVINKRREKMIKYFCDSCGKEHKRNYVNDPLETCWEKFMIKVLIGYDSVFNSGEICKKCLRKALLDSLDL